MSSRTIIVGCCIFDRVPHNRLCEKLSYYGISGPLLLWIKHYLFNRHQRVIIDGFSSYPSVVSSGVPQGTVLAPLLFLCFVNDIPLNVTFKIKLYADDILLYRTISSIDDCTQLQRDIDSLIKWSSTWQLPFNFNKCEFLCITNKFSPITTTYYMDTNSIKQVSSAKYLGVTINEKLQWADHISNITKKASATLGFLHRNLNRCPSFIKTFCYKSLIIPILEYACTVWDPYTRKVINKIDKIQRRAARFTKNNYSWSTSVTGLINDLNWQNLQTRRSNLKLIMMFKITRNLVSIPKSHYLIPCTSSTRHHSSTYKLPYSRVNSHLFSFFLSSIRLWNSLDNETVNQVTLQQFKKRLLNHV